MGTESSKETKTTATGNSNANNITIVDTIGDHSDQLKILLGIIIVILVANLLYKLYKSHRHGIQKQAVRKSKINVEEI